MNVFLFDINQVECIYMNHKLDDWWQTPLGDKGMELRDLIIEALNSLMEDLKKEKRLDETTQKSFDHLVGIIEEEYEKLVN